MPVKLNLEGSRFGKLTVLSYEGNQIWKVRCDCGKEKNMRTANLKAAQSCGCIRVEKAREQGEKRKNYKFCLVCGRKFASPPSSKTVTCSSECRSRRRAALLSEHEMSNKTRQKISSAAKDRGTPKSYDKMINANAASPKCQRGEMHSAAKKWTIKYIDTQEVFSFTNLSEWVRNNLDRFDTISDNPDDNASRISHGFYAIKKNFLKGKNGITYKGWQIVDFDDRKNYERDYK